MDSLRRQLQPARPLFGGRGVVRAAYQRLADPLGDLAVLIASERPGQNRALRSAITCLPKRSDRDACCPTCFLGLDVGPCDPVERGRRRRNCASPPRATAPHRPSKRTDGAAGSVPISGVRADPAGREPKSRSVHPRQRLTAVCASLQRSRGAGERPSAQLAL